MLTSQATEPTRNWTYWPGIIHIQTGVCIPPSEDSSSTAAQAIVRLDYGDPSRSKLAQENLIYRILVDKPSTQARPPVMRPSVPPV